MLRVVDNEAEKFDLGFSRVEEKFDDMLSDFVEESENDQDNIRCNVE